MSRHHRPSIRCAAAPVAALVAALAGAAGCSGDEREFVEAVEVAELGLANLSILAPEDAIVPLRLAPGESVALGLAGAGTGEGQTVEVSGEDRDWTTSDPAVGTVDADGRFTALAVGTTTVGLDIGGVRAGGFPVTVSDAPLSAVTRLEGPDSPEACVGSRYVAFGTFDDGFERLLRRVVWSLPGADSGGDAAPLLREPEDGADGAIELVARAPGPLTLRAGSRGQALDTPLQVPDTLVSIAVTAPPVLRVDDEIDLVATATYRDGGDEGDATRTADVTDAVTFEVDDASLATVSNADGSRGRLEALVQGATNVRARCGDVESPAVRVTVGAGGTGGGGDGDGLAFRVGNSDVEPGDDIEISLTANGSTLSQGNAVELRVSTGDEYDDDDDVTNDVRVVSSNTAVLRIDFGSDEVFLQPLELGSSRVTVTLGDRTASFDVGVVN